MSRLVDLLPDAVLQIDPDGRIVDANLMAEHVTGYPIEQLRGAAAAELLHPQTPDGVRLLKDGLHRSARLRSVTAIPEQHVRLLRADGAETTVYVTGAYQRDGDGAVSGATLVLRGAVRRAHQVPSDRNRLDRVARAAISTHIGEGLHRSSAQPVGSPA
jgi:PAS domain S-box-containing protein